MTRDLVLALRAKRAGARFSLRIVREARIAGLPVSLAFALVDRESAFHNVFGHDEGAYRPGNTVTNQRVRELLDRVDAGGKSNGVGLTQLTWPGYIRQAMAMPGGAALPKNQLRVGFHALAAMIHGHGEYLGLAAYNAGDPRSAQGRKYAREVEALQDHWHRVLAPAKKKR